MFILLSGCVNNNIENSSDVIGDSVEDDDLPIDMDIEDRFIPDSFDKFYKKNSSEYLEKMNELSSSMENVIIDLRDENISNANTSFKIFSKNYKNSLKIIEDWEGYYDTEEIDNLGKAIKSGNISKALETMELVREACTDCHTEIRYVVWAKYEWKDFQDINMNTTDEKESIKSWTTAKTNYLSPGFEGIGISIKEGNKEQALKSIQLFRDMFINMKNACGSCHETEPKYYVSEDVMSKIDDMDRQLSSGNPVKAEEIRLEIRDECHKCHIVHEPLQRIKELEE